MQLLKKQITTPGVDAVIMVLVGWSLMDTGGVAVAVHPVLGKAFWLAGVSCFLIAWWSWRRTPSLLKLAFWHLAVEREMHPLAFCSFGSETS